MAKNTSVDSEQSLNSFVMLFKGLTLEDRDSPLFFVFSWAVVSLHKTRLRIVIQPGEGWEPGPVFTA